MPPSLRRHRRSTVTINDVDFSTWLDLEGSGDFDAFMLSWIGNIDPDDFYYAQHHSDGGFNFQGYSNPEVDNCSTKREWRPTRRHARACTTKPPRSSSTRLRTSTSTTRTTSRAWRSEVAGYSVRGDNAVASSRHHSTRHLHPPGGDGPYLRAPASPEQNWNDRFRDQTHPADARSPCWA